ncbi:hypothetical protein P8452_74871 [Trifolium repens]|nr:hypothetical protein P8452_74871 [Trifolium repens]
MTQEAKSKPFDLAKDVSPQIFSLVHQTVHKYGKNSFLWEGRTPKVIITEPEQIKQVFNKMQDFTKPKFSSIARFFAVGLASYEGEQWAKHRKIINPAFHIDKLKNMLPVFIQSSQDMISKWKEMLTIDGSCEIDVQPFIQNLTCDVISRTAFGSNYVQGSKIFELLRMQGHILINTAHTRTPINWFGPTNSYKRMKEMDREMYDLVEGIIKKRETEMKNGKANNDDLLGILIESNNLEIQGHEKSKTAGMSYDELVKECKQFYIAGQETTSSLLVWTMVLLARYPEWQELARQEVLQVFGNQTPNHNGLNQLKIMTMILYEVLRLYPPTVYLVRATQKNLKLQNLSLPAGVNISIPILLVHHDCDIWGDDAKEFKPERFSEGVAKATKGQVSFFPFGWGPRICIGQNFALLEAKVVLSLLLQNFSFELSADYKHAPTAILSLQPKHGALIRLHKL